MRRFGPWLFGLFLIAQMAGVVPLIFDHTFHVFESQRAISDPHDHSAPGRHGDHRHGMADVKDECCSMHHLVGVSPVALGFARVSFANARIVTPPASPLVNTGPLRLDRPPKSLSLI